jgi:hypothetical protein
MTAIPSKASAGNGNTHRIDGLVTTQHHLIESRCKAHSSFTFFLDFCTLRGNHSAIVLWSQSALLNALYRPIGYII